MKILYCAPRFHTNQIPIIKGLKENGDEVSFWSEYIGGTEDHSILQPVVMKKSWITKIINLYLEKKYYPNIPENKETFWFMPSICWVIKELHKNTPEVVIVRERSFCNFLIKTCAKMQGIKCVLLYNQTAVFKTKDINGLKSKIGKLVFAKTRITPVEYERVATGEEYFKDDNAIFVPFVYDVCDAAFERKYLKHKVPHILEIGKFRDYKDHFTFVKALEILQKKGYLFKATIVGQAVFEQEKEYLNQLMDYIQKAELSNCVMIRQNIPYKQMPECYLEHDIFVLSSKKERASISILEAMAHGLVTISTNKNGTASYIQTGHTGEIFMAEDPESLAEKLEKYFLHSELIEEHGRNAVSVMTKRYTFSQYYSGVLSAIKKDAQR